MIAHPDFIAVLLKSYSDLTGEDITQFHVYGSPMRPISSTWARIEDAIFLPSDKSSTGHHSFVAVPMALPASTIRAFELEAVSPPVMKPARLALIHAVELFCPLCGGTCLNISVGDHIITSADASVRCEVCQTELSIPLLLFKRRSIVTE